MIGFTLVGTNDLERAKAFYDELWAVIGAGRVFGGRRICNWGHDIHTMFGVALPADGGPATVGNGAMVSVHVGSRALVDAVHAKALGLGGVDEGQPGVRREDAGWVEYFGYFRDLDGNKLAVFNRQARNAEPDRTEE